MKSIINKIYGRLSASQLSRFKLFIYSPYYNKSISQQKLYTLLAKDHELSFDVIKKQIFNNKELSLSSYKKLVSVHLNLLKLFFQTENSEVKNSSWLETLYQLNLEPNEISKESKKLRKKFDANLYESKYVNTIDYLDQLQYESKLLKEENKVSFEKLSQNFMYNNHVLDE